MQHNGLWFQFGISKLGQNKFYVEIECMLRYFVMLSKQLWTACKSRLIKTSEIHFIFGDMDYSIKCSDSLRSAISPSNQFMSRFTHIWQQQVHNAETSTACKQLIISNIWRCIFTFENGNDLVSIWILPDYVGND